MSGADRTHAGSNAPEREVAFFGQITASVTHELNNVLAIVEQSAGLLDDMIAGEDRGVPLAIERLKGVSASVQKQAQRGLELVARLNHFAHTTDRYDTDFDMNDILGNLVSLCRRLATLKKLELAFQATGGKLEVAGNPFALQQAVYLALRGALEQAPVGTTIVIATHAAPERVGVSISYSGSGELDGDSISVIRALMQHTGGTAEAGSVNGQMTVLLRPVAH